MPIAATTRTHSEKLAIFRGCFSGLTHVYGTYDLKTRKVRQVKARVTDQVLLRHIEGSQSYGVYLLNGDRTRALAVDFDTDDLNPPIGFQAAAKRYGIHCYIERSKSKGYHAWIFFEEAGVLAAKARVVARHILEEIGHSEAEIFPKQDRLDSRSSYGNFINAPLFGALAPEGRTVFLDPQDPTRPHPDQWGLLANVERVSEKALDEIIEVNGLDRGGDAPDRGHGKAATPVARATFGMPPCAQKMLAEGVTEYQRVACFRLAVQLKKAGLPEDLAVVCLISWASKNRPRKGRTIITESEIVQQVRSAYARSYRSCGCGEPYIRGYCDPECRIPHDPSVRKSKEAM